MPIYAYRCDACGFTKDVLQKISDPQLTVCLSCAKPTFKKQLTAAGFQLKGTGWYATDFRGGAAPSTAVPTGPAETAPAASKEAAPAAPAASAEVKATPSGNA
jgi:putative FmdB family regulatory protein